MCYFAAGGVLGGGWVVFICLWVFIRSWVVTFSGFVFVRLSP